MSTNTNGQDESQLLRELGKQTGDLIQGYAGAMIIGPRPSEGEEINHGSGIIVDYCDAFFFVTAWHVLDAYQGKTGDDDRVIAHLAFAQFDAGDRIVAKDQDADVVFLRISKEEADALGTWRYAPPRWPPTVPEAGQLVGLVGYPGVVLQRSGPKTVHFNAFAVQTEVTSVNEERAPANSGENSGEGGWRGDFLDFGREHSGGVCGRSFL